MPDLTTRQGLSRLLTITDHKRDLSGDRIEAKLIDAAEEAVVIGSGYGESVGEPILINLSFDDVPTGRYRLRVCGPDEMIFPVDETEFDVRVHESC